MKRLADGGGGADQPDIRQIFTVAEAGDTDPAESSETGEHEIKLTENETKYACAKPPP
jgi:hypothetical protein